MPMLARKYRFILASISLSLHKRECSHLERVPVSHVPPNEAQQRAFMVPPFSWRALETRLGGKCCNVVVGGVRDL